MGNGVTVSNVATASQQDIIDSLTEQLAKANERIEQLEQANLELSANVEACCELTEMGMGAAIERLFEIDNTESKALLNKFAIEQKIESLEELHSFFLNEFDWKFPDDTHVKFMDVGVAVNARIAQLRKE
jgi:hypothetical protein